VSIKVTSSPRASFRAAAILLPETSTKGVSAAALAMKKTIVQGAPSRLRGVGKRGGRLGVRYEVKRGVEPTAIVRAVGPWQLIESDTKPHTIGPKRRRANSRRQAAVLTPYGPRRAVHHPGTRGQHPWAKGVERGTPAATLAYTRVVRADLRKQFG
jgi:hypothetical protein